MVVKVLKAGNGDSILIHYEDYNILIDGGNDSTYLLAQIEEVFQKKQRIDLLIVTHHDDDHIKGILSLLKVVHERLEEGPTTLIKQVIFNSPKKALLQEKELDSSLLSYKQANEADELLRKIGLKWEVVNENSKPIIFKELIIRFLSPTQEDIDKFSRGTPAEYLTSDYKCDWGSPLSLLEKHIDDKSQDSSISNKSSVVVYLECEGKRMLFTGDVTPDRLENVLTKLMAENNEEKVCFDLIKLPHHGSYRSLNKKIIEKISCTNFVISTNGKKHFLPNKRALLKIIKFLDRGREPINFIFNYSEALNNLQITDKEKKDYNFILTPNNNNYGFAI